MATEIVQVPPRANSTTATPADVAAFAAASHVRPTAPLPADAVKAMARLEAELPAAVAEQYRIERVATGLHAGESAVINGTTVTAVSLAVAEAVTRYETASVHAVQLAARAESGGLSDLDADSLAHAEDLMAGARAVLAEAGMLRLIADPATVIAEAVEGLESGRVAPFDGYDAQAIAETLRVQAAGGKLGEAAAYRTAQRLIGGA